MTTAASTSLGETIAFSFTRSFGLADALLKDVDFSKASSMPVFGDTVVNTNHPAFIYGHLSLYPAWLFSLIGGVDASEIAVPEGYEGLFKHGVECEHDPEGSKYPPLDEIVAYFKKGHEFVRRELPKVSDEVFAQAVSDERAAEFFGTNGSMSVFMLQGHFMFHLGQMSAWRRCMGLGHAM